MSKPTKISKRQLSLWDEEALEAISASSDSWRQRYDSETSLAEPSQTAPGRASGATKVQALHTPTDIDRWSFNDELGFPGEYPLTRGIYPSMYRGRLWTMRQYAGFATAEATNERFRYLLDRGQTGLSTAFDLAT